MENETEKDLKQHVKDCSDIMKIPYEDNFIDRVHRIGKEYTDVKTGKKVRSLIIKFKSWDSRARFYKSRPRNFNKDGTKKPESNSFFVSIDFTKRRNDLL